MTGLIAWIILVVAVGAIAWIAIRIMEGDVYFATVVLVLWLIVGGLLTVNLWAVTYRNDHWATCHVTGKDRGGDGGSYRVYTSDCGQLGNEDSKFRAKFNSADVWEKIPEKGVVRLRIAGSRWGFRSQFPNIYDVQPAEESIKS